MKNIFLILCSFIFFQICNAQKWKEPMQSTLEKLDKDPNLKHAIISFTVMDAHTGEIVFEKNSELGLPTASTQKVITAICAYELLGRNFKYETNFETNKKPVYEGDYLFINGSYDPTLGSWRYANTSSDKILDTLSKILLKNKIHKIRTIANQGSYNTTNYVSDAWIYEDLGNYYGAICEPFMWHENQYDIVLNRDEAGKVMIRNTNPSWVNSILNIDAEINNGAKGSGDNTCIYKMPFNNNVIAKGTLGTELNNFEISGSLDGGTYFTNALNRVLNKENEKNIYQDAIYKSANNQIIFKHYSPSLDSINYWFLKKSLNLYGEALLRTMALKYSKTPDYNKGIEYIHSICKKINVDTAAVHIFDGCGLSPQNRISTKALCKFMQYAYGKDYYKHFYNCLPVINDISMKSGSIHGSRAYTGYINSADNNVYTFAIAVNNYDGNGKDMQTKLWKVLDVLK